MFTFRIVACVGHGLVHKDWRLKTPGHVYVIKWSPDNYTLLESGLVAITEFIREQHQSSTHYSLDDHLNACKKFYTENLKVFCDEGTSGLAILNNQAQLTGSKPGGSICNRFMSELSREEEIKWNVVWGTHWTGDGFYMVNVLKGKVFTLNDVFNEISKWGHHGDTVVHWLGCAAKLDMDALKNSSLKSAGRDGCVGGSTTSASSAKLRPEIL